MSLFDVFFFFLLMFFYLWTWKRRRYQRFLLCGCRNSVKPPYTNPVSSRIIPLCATQSEPSSAIPPSISSLRRSLEYMLSMCKVHRGSSRSASSRYKDMKQWITFVKRKRFMVDPKRFGHRSKWDVSSNVLSINKGHKWVIGRLCTLRATNTASVSSFDCGHESGHMSACISWKEREGEQERARATDSCAPIWQALSQLLGARLHVAPLRGHSSRYNAVTRLQAYQNMHNMSGLLKLCCISQHTEMCERFMGPHKRKNL